MYVEEVRGQEVDRTYWDAKVGGMQIADGVLGIVNELAAEPFQLDVNVAELLRKGEEEFINASDLPHLDDEAAVAQWIHEHPKVLQRPIAIDEASGKAVVGRPPENVLELIRQ